MKRNFIIFLIFSIVLFFIVFFFIFNTFKHISSDLILEFEEKKDVAIKNKIVSQVLNDSKKINWLKSVNDSSLSIQFGDVCGDSSDEAVLIIKLTDKDSIIAVYKKRGNKYLYECLIDTFFNIKDVQLLKLKESGKNIVLIREYANQLIGAYEVGTFIRGYLYNKNKFNLVLNITEDYKAYWNELWNGNKSESHWLRICQDTKVSWENGVYPVINLVYFQNLSRSDTINSVKIPVDDDFNVINTKEVSETYFWNRKWNHFILFEGIDSTSGQEVAVIEDLTHSPFTLDLNANTSNSYRIKNKYGKIEVVDKSSIKILNRENKIFFTT